MRPSRSNNSKKFELVQALTRCKPFSNPSFSAIRSFRTETNADALIFNENMRAGVHLMFTVIWSEDIAANVQMYTSFVY